MGRLAPPGGWLGVGGGYSLFSFDQGVRDTPLGLNANELVRAIRTGQLHVLPRLHIRPIDVVVDHGSRRDLVLRRVSRLDAFSGYPIRTWLPGGAAGATTGPPEVRPPRSSRTKGRSSQNSYSHGR